MPSVSIAPRKLFRSLPAPKKRNKLGLTNPNLPLHPLPVLVPTLLLDQVVLLQSLLERILETTNLSFPDIEIRIPGLTRLVLRVQFRDPVANRLGQP